MTEMIDLRPHDLQIVHEILDAKLPAQTAVYVFGSRATGKARKASDLDLAIDAGRVLSRREMAGLADAFDESDLFCNVDLVDLHDTGAAFLALVRAQMVPLGGPFSRLSREKGSQFPPLAQGSSHNR